MKKITDYIIINDAKLNSGTLFWMVIDEKIQKGWQPYGNPFINSAGYTCQAMVKYHPTHTI